MAQDPNISVPVGTSTSVKTITENQSHGVSFDAGGGGTQHIQVIAVGVHDGSGKTLDIVTQAQPLPVTFPTSASEAYDRIKELSDGLSMAPSSGVTAFRVKIDSNSGLVLFENSLCSFQISIHTKDTLNFHTVRIDVIDRSDDDVGKK